MNLQIRNITTGYIARGADKEAVVGVDAVVEIVCRASKAVGIGHVDCAIRLVGETCRELGHQDVVERIALLIGASALSFLKLHVVALSVDVFDAVA